MEKPIHIVITYVDGNDPEWQAAHTQYVGESVTAKRFRDWGTLPFLLRAIEQHMPFVSDVWLVVSSDSQVPAWVDRSQLHIVRHSDIIPAEYLPTFNSATIEMFLYRIPGLSERFLYFNDDCFPMKPCKETDFFQGDKVVVGHTRQWITAGNNYRLRVRNSSNLARRALGLRETKSYVRPQHTCIPMLTSQCEALMAKMGDEIGKKSPAHAPATTTTNTFSPTISTTSIAPSTVSCPTSTSRSPWPPSTKSHGSWPNRHVSWCASTMWR